MSLRPWREVAQPHKDVLEGTFKQSEFAADISQVAVDKKAPPEYQDPEKFFARTFVTEGMRLLLRSVAQRLAGKDGDPVIQLQTAFGGGKTHTMLAVYHLASRQVSTAKLAGIPPILDDAGIDELPTAHVAVIDGIRLSPSQPQNHDGLLVNTLWGEVVFQLLGKDGYELIKDSDLDGTSPGKAVIKKLVEQAAPCVILMDELVAYMRQFESGQKYKGGTFDSNITFIQALTEAMKSVPNAVLLASLPESELEVGGQMGRTALESLEKYFARVESVWKPVASEEAFEIVRRRLFEHAGDAAVVEGISRQFSDFYRQHADAFPVETQSNQYYEQLSKSYPIHPEVFDRLYEDWSTLDKFQRTRGVLQYMAVVIHRLWNDNNQDALILPGSIPLDDAVVRNKSIHYLPQGWEPVIEREVDGPRSETHRIDGDDTRFGGVQAAHRVMRTIFLGSAPAVQSQVVKGIEVERILLGAVQPGQTVGIFQDVLKRLRDKLQYLYSDQNRFWLDTKPNLRREMESRKQNINEKEDLFPELKSRVQRVFGSRHMFSGIHVFMPSSDIPDEFGAGPKLVVLGPGQGFTKADPSRAQDAAFEILKNRGEQPRQKQNRLIFLAPDADTVSRLKDAGRTYLAWKEIVTDLNDGKLNLDLFQVGQAKKNCDAAEKNLSQAVRESYKWLLCPFQHSAKEQKIDWEAVSLSTNAPNLVQEIENKLREEEWVITEWSPIHLKNMLNQWYFKDGANTVSALKVWQDTCHYLYLPRLANDSVYREALSVGIGSVDFFGYASGKDGDRYLGFVFDRGGVVTIDDASLIIELEEAKRFKELVRPVMPGERAPASTDAPPVSVPGSGDVQPTPSAGPGGSAPTVETRTKRRFYGTINIDPVGATFKFSDIVDEVVQQFATKTGVDVTISVEINASSKLGFDEALQRAVKENCNVLNFSSSEFEE